MKRVLVIGCPGSGKSTFARRLREATGLPLFYLDRIWHRPDRTTVTREEFDTRLGEILAKEAWILDGNYSRTLERRLVACDTVFFFDLPTETCLAGIAERVGKPREDMPWVEERVDEDFKAFVEAFQTERKPAITELLESYGGEKSVTVFRSREEAEEFLKNGNHP